MDDLHLFDLQTHRGPVVLKGHTNTLRSAAFSPDGKWLATVSDDRLLKVWRLPDGVEAYSIVAHPGAVNSVAFSPDGRTLATAGQGEAVKLWHVETGQPLGKLIDERAEFWKVQFTTDGQRLVGEFRDGSMVVYDASH
jgi:WD40 repeat protein